MPEITTYVFAIQAAARIAGGNEQVLTADGDLTTARPFSSDEVRSEALRLVLAKANASRPPTDYEITRFTYTELPAA